MAEIPKMNLSPEATPWGREMQNRIVELQSTIDRLRQSMENSDRVQNGTLRALSETVGDLSERRAYYASSSYSLIWSASTGSTATGLSLSFTISQNRSVLVRCMIDSYIEINATASRTGTNQVSVSGLPQTLTGFTIFNSLGLGASARIGTIADGERVYQLTPGTYNLEVSVAGSTSGGSGVSGTIQNPSIFVQVMDVW